MSTSVDEFSNTLQALLSVKPPGVSGSKIKKLTEIAVANVESESVLIQKLFTHFKKTPASHKLGALYVVDSIARAYQDEAKKSNQTISNSAPEGTYAAGVNRVLEIIEVLISDFFSSNPPEDQKEKVRKVVDIWERAETFPQATIDSIRDKYFRPGARSTTPPGPPPVHLLAGDNKPAAAPAAPSVPDTSAILKVLENISKQNTSGSQPLPQTSILQPPSSGIPQSVSPPGAPSSSAAPAASAQQLQLMQMLLSQNIQPNQLQSLLQQSQQLQGGNTGAANVAGQPWNLPQSGGNDYRSQERIRSPPSGYDRGRGRRSPSPPNRYRDDRDDRRGRGARSRSPMRRNASPPRYGQDSEPSEVRPRNLSYDNNLPPGTVKVFSRTLFIGGVPPYMTEEELVDLFTPYAKVQSMVFHKEKKHAFVKVYSRAEAEVAKERFEDQNKQGALSLRARWGVGFGPRDCSDYQTGISIIPLNRLTDADKRWMTQAEYGGTGGRPLEAGVVVEEPDIEIGSGVSSKAISRRMPTNSSRNGPRSSRTDPMNEFGGGGGYGGGNGGGNGGGRNSWGDDDGMRRGTGSNSEALRSGGPGGPPGSNNGAFPANLASFLSNLPGQQSQPSQATSQLHQLQQLPQTGNTYGQPAGTFGATAPTGQPGAQNNGQYPFPFPPQMAAFFQQQNQPK